MAQGKFSQPRQPKHDEMDVPVRKPIPTPKPSAPIEDLSDEVVAFLRETDTEEAAFAPPAAWKSETRIMPETWKDQTQVAGEDWRTDTRKVPEGWRDQTQVVPPRTHPGSYPPRQPQQPAYQRPVNQNPYREPPYPRTPAQPTEEWDLSEPQQSRPVVRNHMVDREEPEDYGYDDVPRNGGSRNDRQQQKVFGAFGGKISVGACRDARNHQHQCDPEPAQGHGALYERHPRRI